MRFVSKFHPRIVRFKDLPRPCKLAVIWWMVVDGHAWEASDHIQAAYKVAQVTGGGWRKYTSLMRPAVVSSMGFYNGKYGKTRWGIATIPLREFVDWMASPKKGFGDYHTAYCKNNPVEEHPKRNRWPLIIDPRSGSIRDGYHRFHTYINQGAKKAPCVWQENT